MKAVPNYPPSPTSKKKMQEILEWLRQSSLSEYTRIFGSYPYHEGIPVDLDVLVDLNEEMVDHAMRADLKTLLTMSSSSYRKEEVTGANGKFTQGRYHGLLDPYVKLKGRELVTRDGLGWRWAEVKRAAHFYDKIKNDGVKLTELER